MNILINSMDKSGFVWIVALVIVVAVVLGGFFFFNSDKTDSSSNTEDNAATSGQVNANSDSDSTETQQQPSQTSSSDIKEFSIVAKKYEFVPGTITVNEGDTVVLNIESIDVEHGFALPTFGVNEQLSPGNEITVQFVADQKGTFSFFCNVYCGSGHSGMRGTLVVE